MISEKDSCSSEEGSEGECGGGGAVAARVLALAVPALELVGPSPLQAPVRGGHLLGTLTVDSHCLVITHQDVLFNFSTKSVLWITFLEDVSIGFVSSRFASISMGPFCVALEAIQ